MAKKRMPPQRHNDVLLTATVRKELERQHAAGLKSGVYAVCKVVHDKATAAGKTAEERLEDITAFVSLWNKLPGQKDTEESHEV